jgi:Glyoxalase-like domain
VPEMSLPQLAAVVVGNGQQTWSMAKPPGAGWTGTMTDTSDATGDLRLGAVVINVQDMKRAVDFWTAALGYHRRDPEWDTQFMTLVERARHRLAVSLQLTDSRQVEPARVHLDRYTRERARHVERLIGLGETAWRTGLTRKMRTSSSCAIRTATSSASSTIPGREHELAARLALRPGHHRGTARPPGSPPAA